MGEVRFGVIGAGNMGSGHIRTLTSGAIRGARLAAICDINPKALQGRGDVPTFTNSDELLSSGKVDAVVVATPHYFHTTIGIAALDSGHHVLVEKPISVHKADCERLIAAHKRNPERCSRRCSTSAPTRSIQKIREMVQSGELGRFAARQLDHHQLVPHAGLLRLRRLARDLGRRGRRRAAQPVPAQPRPAAVDHRDAG